jgi:hypothetical protein
MIQGWSHGVAIGRYFNRRYDVKSELRNLWKIEEIEFKSVMGKKNNNLKRKHFEEN